MPVTVDCVDCITEGITTHRPIVSGTRKPRCATHDRAVRKRTKSRAHTRRIENHYDLTEEGYWALYRYQNGVCYICGVATGKTKRLAVDHDHSICSEHPPEMGCPRCIRGLLCGRCNQLVAWFGVESLCRAVYYLQHPPARKFFQTRVAKAEYL